MRTFVVSRTCYFTGYFSDNPILILTLYLTSLFKYVILIFARPECIKFNRTLQKHLSLFLTFLELCIQHDFLNTFILPVQNVLHSTGLFRKFGGSR